MKSTKDISVFLCSLFLIISCSTQKNNFVSRNFNTLITKYNVLFNGKQAFEKGIKQINDNYKDNYRKLLPIEPIKFDMDKVIVPKFKPNNGSEEDQKDKQKNTFEKAEEKAVKAIQKYSMELGDRQRNRQIDDAYLLLGKARYYTQRFIPAIEAFNYLIANYPYSNLSDQTRIWRAKTNIRLDNQELAIETLKILLKQKKIEPKIREEAYTALAMGYIKSDSIQRAIKTLNLATTTRENKVQTARNMFILGQLYSLKQKKDSAAMAFKKLIDFKKAPYIYRIHAYIARADNLTKDSESIELLEQFKKMVKNHDNKNYLDKLYFHMGVIEQKRDSLENAVKLFKKSLQIEKTTDYQKTFAYEHLGNIRFDKGDFIRANTYYDSVLQATKNEFKNELRIRRIRRKHNSLSSLVKFESILKNNDSILNLVKMTKQQQKQYFENYIKKIKKEDKEREQQELNSLSSKNNPIRDLSLVTRKGKWYFYNKKSVQLGISQFKKVWGNRPLEDNWRLSNKSITKNVLASKKPEDDTNKKYEVATYLEQLPKDKNTIDSLRQQRNKALYELGLIYKEQFKNPNLAIKNLERLRKINTDKKLELPIGFHLHQLYKTTKNQSKSEYYKNFILGNYPKTKYARMIEFPDEKLKRVKSLGKVQKEYKKLYLLYKKDKFKVVVKKIDSILPSIKTDVLIPKFELLKAYSIGQYMHKVEFKKAIKHVSLNYANTQEGKRAEQILKLLDKKQRQTPSN